MSGWGVYPHPTLPPQAQLGGVKLTHFAWSPFFARCRFRRNVQQAKNRSRGRFDGLRRPIWDNFRCHFWGRTGSAHAFLCFANGVRRANGRRPRGPVNIGSKCTCVVGVLHCVGFEIRVLDLGLWPFFEAFVASPIQRPFKTAFEIDFCRNQRFFGRNLGAKMAGKTGGT